MRGNGADWLDPEGKKLIVGSPAGIAALNTYRDLFLRHRVASPIGGPVSNADLFAQGRLALWQQSYGGQFAPGEQRIAGKFRWGMVLIPKGSAGKIGTQLTVNGMTISANCQSPGRRLEVPQVHHGAGDAAARPSSPAPAARDCAGPSCATPSWPAT